MSISFSAMNRLVEQRAAEDEAYRRQLVLNGKHTLADGRALSDRALLDKLRGLGLSEACRDWLDELSRQYVSAQTVATRAIENAGIEIPDEEDDWVWIAVTCLWERWFPDRPNFEMLDDWMQEGYQLEKRGQPVEAARLWLKTWRAVLQLINGCDIPSIEAFDEAFGGTQSVFNWVQDFSAALAHAASADRSLFQERIALCRAVLDVACHAERDAPLVEQFRRDLAEAHAALGDLETADRLLAGWLRDDPRWGGGWLAWSNSYCDSMFGYRFDAARAEQLLNEGLAVTGVRDRKDLVGHLEWLRENAGQLAEDVSRARQRRLDEVVAELNREYSGVLPEAALREAQRGREEITPRLIDLIRDAAAAVRRGGKPAGEGHFIALFLLTEFEAKEALPAILEAVSLPGDGPSELFGDAITEMLPGVLAVLAVDRPALIDELIANRSLSQYVRSAAADTCLYWVRDGRMTRDQAVERLRGHLRDAVENQDVELVTPLIMALDAYAAPEALVDIEKAFEADLVETMWIDLKTVRDSIREGESRFQEALEMCYESGVNDTVAELREWAAFREDDDDDEVIGVSPYEGHDWEQESKEVWRELEEDESADEPEDERDLDEALGLEEADPLDHPAPIRRTTPRVGRNDPCPCGSGKKFKKCCRLK